MSGVSEKFESYMGVVPRGLHHMFDIFKQLEYIQEYGDNKLYKEVSEYYLLCRFKLLNHEPIDEEEVKLWWDENLEFKELLSSED